MGYAPLVYKKAGGDTLVVASGGKIEIESGGEIELQAGAIADITDKLLAGGDIALADGKILVGDGTGKGAAVTPSGDVTITNAGVTAVGAGRVTSAMLASGAGVAALLTAGLGGSHTVLKTDAATTTLVALNAAKARACLVVVRVDETYAVGTGTLPTVKIGETGALEACMAATVLDTEAAGTVLVFAFTNTANKAIVVTTTAAIGNSTGGCSITVLAIPTT